MESEIYPGCRRLVEALDRAVASSRAQEWITRAVQHELTEVILDGGLELPAALRAPVPGSYARRLIHANPELGYTALAMVWGVGQGTPVHDHAGMWCVEGVIEGQILVTQYRLLEQRGSEFRFERQGTAEAGIGAAGRLIPPFDYHTIHNALPDQPSITIHVYGGEMSHCSIFQPLQADWYEQVERKLALTA